MHCLILCAGYATRLYPLTENFPKPLLPVQGKSVLDWLLSDVDTIPGIDRYVIISNHKFYDHFASWKESSTHSHSITILDDGSTDNENRLGAVKDILFAIDQLDLKEDLLVLAGDNLLDFSFSGFVSFFREKQGTCIMRHYEPSITRLQRTGVASIDDSDKVLLMKEKPKEPKSTGQYLLSTSTREKISPRLSRRLLQAVIPMPRGPSFPGCVTRLLSMRTLCRASGGILGTLMIMSK